MFRFILHLNSSVWGIYGAHNHIPRNVSNLASLYQITGAMSQPMHVKFQSDCGQKKGLQLLSIHVANGHVSDDNAYPDDVIKWNHFPRYCPFVRGIHRSSVNSPHKGQWRGALMFSLICPWINGWVNYREAGDLRRHRGHCDVSVMFGYMMCVQDSFCKWA